DNKDLSWKLISTLQSRDGNLEWNKRIGALPAYTSAEEDPFFAGDQFKGWFEELADPDTVPTVMPTYLEEFAFFKDSLAISTSQEALLGDLTVEELANQWADYLTKAQKKHLAKP
ncbi:MAG: sugar ABC transporter substrate-binding protein, partial [Pseudomonadota bacterium]|nr:sugar ABC transporter substrate-binding protein [Pseudomonadota bacterium]